MKKYVLAIIAIGVILCGVLTYNVIKIQNSNTQTFYDSGYILKSTYDGSRTQNVERYYFNANQSYQTKYNEKVIFKDTNGEEITTDKYNFIHYTNGSVSALENGVILNLKNIDDEPITYYNILAGKVLKKAGSNYSIQHLGKELQFTNLIWKISANKYLMIGNPINIIFNDGTTKAVNGYIEIEYMDNEIIKIYNQEATYQTISSKVYLEMPDGIKVNLGTKIVSKNGENKMSLENMVINSDDNVEIVDLDQYKEDTEDQNEVDNNTIDNTVDNTVDNNIDNNNTNPQDVINTVNNIVNSNNNTNIDNVSNVDNNTNIDNNQNINNNEDNNTDNTDNNGDNNTDNTDNNNGDNNNGGDNIVVPGDDDNNGDDNNGDGDGGDIVIPDDNTNEEEVKEKPNVNEPVYKVESFEVSSISLNARITIQDEDSLLVGDNNIKIVRNDTGKTVYETVEDYGVINIEVSVATLSPDTEYTLSIESTYQVEDIQYTKNFIYKIFRTEFVGVDFEKDYFTNNKMAFKINFERDSKVVGADMVLMDTYGEVIETKSVQNMEADAQNTVEFLDLDSNTSYVVKLTNVLYDGQVITNGFEISKQFKTLKDKPSIDGVEFEIDKRNATFTLRVKNIIDPSKGISSYRYEIYDTRKDLKPENAVSVVTLDHYEDLKVNVDDIKIYRGVPYTFKVIATFNDNEKIIEYESEYSNVMILEGVQFPTVRFEETDVTFERIQGNLIIDDNNNTIKLDDTNKFIVTYTDSVGITKTFTSQGSLLIPIDINGLRSNETYKFSIYTRVDLQDGNDPIDECYIGGAVIQTKTPNNLVATFTENEEDVTTPFSVRFRLQNTDGVSDELEAQTLSGMTFSIYAGQDISGTLVKTLKVVDRNTEPYESNLKQEYYDQETTLTPSFFGAKNSDFKEKYYTIAVTDGYDYTQYPNKLPIIQNTFTIETNGYMPDIPVDTDNAVEVTVIRNRDREQREDLDASTITGYELKASYDNSQLLAKKIVYKAYDADTGTLIAEKELEFDETGTVPTCTFDVLDGTVLSTVDTDALRRGNSYYFTYEAYLDLDHDGTAETKYPYVTGEEEIILKSKTVSPTKQEAKFTMYPSISTSSTITYKYKFTDIDYTLETNDMKAIIGTTVRDTKPIVMTTGDQFNTITFNNLIAGNLKLSVNSTISKKQSSTLRDITAHTFEGEVTVSDIKYNVSLDSNRVVITLLNAENKIDRIGAVNVEFSADGATTITKEFLKPENNIITISLNDLEPLLNKQVNVNVYAYYDTGIMGYDENSLYIAYEKAHSQEETKYYYALNSSGELTESASLTDNMYMSIRNGNQIQITQLSGNYRTATITLNYGQTGFLYKDNTIIQKKVSKVALNSDGSNMIFFDKIIPGISMKGSGSTLNLTADLDTVRFKASIINTKKVIIQDNLIYIDLYNTDENAKNEQFVKTITKNISDFDNVIELTDLQPKNYYYIQFRAIIQKQDGTTEEVELYDVDQQITGRHYYFSTLANVGISNINIEYNPQSYNSKTLDISYNLDKILGYQKIEYTIYKYNEETGNYDLFMENIEDTLLKRDMLKQIDANPGSAFEFNQKYKVKIEPLAIYTDTDGVERRIELGTVEKEFKLQELRAPTIGRNAVRETNNNVEELKFKITIYDQDRVIENDKYKIKVLNYQQLDITPEEYKDKEFSTDLVNNTITITGADKYKDYTIEVITRVDFDNDGKDLTEYKVTYTAPAVNESGISVGNITVSPNSSNLEKLDLIFNNSYKLLEVDQLRYSIYNTNGYATNGTVNFVPTEVNNAGDVYYIFTLDENLAKTGSYYIELQFLIDNEIVDTASLEYTYIE